VKISVAVCALTLGLSAGPATPAPLDLGRHIIGDRLPPHEVTAIVRSAGFMPTTPPVLTGTAYVLSAVDVYGTPVRVAIDARFGEILSVRRVAAVAPLRPPYPVPGGPGLNVFRAMPPGIYGDGVPMPQPVPNARPSPPSDQFAVVRATAPPVPKPRPQTPSIKPRLAKPEPAAPSGPSSPIDAKPEVAQSPSAPAALTPAPTAASLKQQPKATAFPPAP
jgi:hypothetical protein